MKACTGRALRLALAFGYAFAALAGEAIILDRSHFSQVFGEERNYRIFLPPDYATSGKRYPVVYWFHGWSERYNRPVAGDPHRNYDAGTDYGGDNIANFVGSHDLIVVKWDGYNPRTPGEKYPRPYNISPVETERQFPLYFPELVSYIDAHYPTIADREHRATAGLSMGGFMSFWVSGKYPHLVGSASNFMGSSEFFVGPRGFPVEYRHEEMHNNYEGMRTRMVKGSKDFIQFYHRRMNAIWNYTRPYHETEEFEADHGTPGMARTLAFHMNAFAHPLPPPEVWHHNDVYPDFSVWGWEVHSDRRVPGLTALENVSASGFRSSVREWLYGGNCMPQVKVTILSARLYPPGKRQAITYVRVRDGKVRLERENADAEGRLHFELDGDAYEVGVGPAAVPALDGFTVQDAGWATAGKPVRVRVRFWNKGATASAPARFAWETPNGSVYLKTRFAAVPALAPGKWAEIPLEFLVRDEQREIVRLFAAGGGKKLMLEIPLFPPASPASEFRIADGKSLSVFQEGVQKRQLRLGEGNGDGVAQAGERIAILLPDGDAFRAAELFTNDACMDNSQRVSDVWGNYDHVGASAKYSLPLIAPGCPAGHRVRLLARVQLPDKPNHHIRYAVIEFRAGSPTRKSHSE